jgi:hypothetical protein
MQFTSVAQVTTYPPAWNVNLNQGVSTFLGWTAYIQLKAPSKYAQHPGWGTYATSASIVTYSTAPSTWYILPQWCYQDTGTSVPSLYNLYKGLNVNLPSGCTWTTQCSSIHAIPQAVVAQIIASSFGAGDIARLVNALMVSLQATGWAPLTVQSYPVCSYKIYDLRGNAISFPIAIDVATAAETLYDKVQLAMVPPMPMTPVYMPNVRLTDYWFANDYANTNWIIEDTPGIYLPDIATSPVPPRSIRCTYGADTLERLVRNRNNDCSVCNRYVTDFLLSDWSWEIVSDLWPWKALVCAPKYAYSSV